MTEPTATATTIASTVDENPKEAQNNVTDAGNDKGGDVLDKMPFGWYVDGAVDPADSQRWREAAQKGGENIVSAQEVLSAITAVLSIREEAEKAQHEAVVGADEASSSASSA